MFEKILNLFSGEKISASTQEESEATVLLITLLYRADKKITLGEQELLAKILPSLEWSSSIHVETFQTDAISKVDLAIKNNNVEAFINAAVEKIKFKDELLSLLNEVARSDGGLDLQEQKIINLVQSALAR
jgi:hypothetical protein